MRHELRYLVLKLCGRYGFIKKGKRINAKWYGNDYGGFYICPSLLNRDSIVYSFGIGEDISFDSTVIERHQCTVYGFDPTPKSIDWIKQQRLPHGFIFKEYGISNKDGFVDFYLPTNTNHVSGSLVKNSKLSSERTVSVTVKTLRSIVQELKHDHIDVLKLDIEGAEYNVVEDILDTHIRIDQILIEFHDRMIKDGRTLTRKTVEKMHQKGFVVSDVSDSFQEVSFIKEELVGKVN